MPMHKYSYNIAHNYPNPFILGHPEYDLSHINRGEMKPQVANLTPICYMDVDSFSYVIHIQFCEPVPFVIGQLKHPRGLAAIEEGIYIADKGNENDKGCIVYTRGTQGHTENEEAVKTSILTPYGIALDEDCNVYATDREYHHLYKFDKQLKFVDKAGTGKGGWEEEEFYFPHGIEIICGMVHVCDYHSSRVKVYDQDFSFKYSFGKDPRQTLFGPVHIANDSRNDLYIVDNRKMAVVKFQWSENGPPIFDQNIGHDELQQPSCLTVDSHDYIYVIDEQRKIIVYKATGKFIMEILSEVIQAPRAICCIKGPQGSSTLYVSDEDSEVSVWKCNIEYS